MFNLSELYIHSATRQMYYSFKATLAHCYTYMSCSHLPTTPDWQLLILDIHGRTTGHDPINHGSDRVPGLLPAYMTWLTQRRRMFPVCGTQTGDECIVILARYESSQSELEGTQATPPSSTYKSDEIFTPKNQHGKSRSKHHVDERLVTL